MSMPCKGVVVVPPKAPAYRAGEGAPGTQRVANRPIVCHVLDALREAGARDLAVVGPPAELAELRRSIDDDVLHHEVAYLPAAGLSGSLGELSVAAQFVGDASCILHSAAGLVGQPLSPLAERVGTDQADLLLLLHRSLDRRDGLGAAMEGLLGITQLKGATARLGLAGVCLFGSGVLDRACREPHHCDSALEVAAIAQRVARSGQRVEAAFVQTWRRYTGRPADLLELNRMVLDQQLADAQSFEGTDNRIEGRVVIDPSANVTSSVILGPSIIGPNAHVASSYVGPYTSIGAGARIEGSEVERSIVLDGARIAHVSGRIEASTVGRRASIFRDFGLPRAVRMHVGEDVEVAVS
jgi:glucose-1-phosphate thymidylyltransferase